MGVWKVTTENYSLNVWQYSQTHKKWQHSVTGAMIEVYKEQKTSTTSLTWELLSNAQT